MNLRQSFAAVLAVASVGCSPQAPSKCPCPDCPRGGANDNINWPLQNTPRPKPSPSPAPPRPIEPGALETISAMFESRACASVAESLGLRGERVETLPEDAGRWQTVVAYSGDLVADKSVADAFAGTPRLKKLMSQTTFQTMTPDHWWAKKHYASTPRPMVLVMDPNGGRVYQASGPNLPPTGEKLADEIQRKLEAVGDCPDGRCPQPPVPAVTPGPGGKPDLRPDSVVPGVGGNFDTLIVIGAVVVVAVLYFANRSNAGE